MKIGIITQPLHINYGGLLQNYALQQVLKSLGHDTITLRRNHLGVHTAGTVRRLRWKIKRAFKRLIGRKYPPSYEELSTIHKHCQQFVLNNINATAVIKDEKELQQYIEQHPLDAYVVGSDQVWRPPYSNNIYTDFLAFCQHKKGIKRVAYAASFGVDEWEYTPKQTKECTRLAKMFDAVSVREESGVTLCNKYFGIEATHLLDPTMLLPQEHYTQLTVKAGEQQSPGNLFCYILDPNDSKTAAIAQMEQTLSLKSFQVKAKEDIWLLKRGTNINDLVVPPPTQWLRAFADAQMVLTDSFHGCVFSIIYNKPFWVITNEKRGNARFDSLLKMFNLQSRIIDLNDTKNHDFTAPIDWQSVNSIKERMQQKSLQFLKDNL